MNAQETESKDADRNETSRETRRKNTIRALRWISEFGWIRPAELGVLMWPGMKSTKTNGARLATQLIERQLVIERKLPEGAGRAIVLSLAGCRVLAEQSISAASGKDIGTATPDGWIPRLSWRHDLLAHSLLAHLHRVGFEIWPEHLIRRLMDVETNRASTGSDKREHRKIPDGLAKKGNHVLWVEVERARKSGGHLEDLANAVINAYRGKLSVANMCATIALVVYVPSAKSELGYHVDHRTRITNAIEVLAGSDVKVMWCACELRGASLDKMKFDEVVIQGGDRVRFVLKQLERIGWQTKPDNSSVKGSHFNGLTAEVWKTREGWGYIAKHGENRISSAGLADSVSAAKYAVAKILAGYKPDEA
jgi:hypothetical protein